MADKTPFSLLLSRIQAGEGVSTLDVPEDWLQGRTLFGGLQAVIGLAAMRSIAPEAPLRSLQVTFLAPVPGGIVQARARVLRSGKSATPVERASSMATTRSPSWSACSDFRGLRP